MNTCFCCGGPFHPATGHYHQPDVPVCGACTRRFVRWLKGHLKRRWGGHEFYAEAATSIRPGASSNGRAAVLQTADGGSIPSAPTNAEFFPDRRS